MKDFSKYKFRCSSLGALMTEPRSKSELLSQTTKAELVKIYIREVYGREKEISSKYIAKGNQVEEDSITLLSRLKKEPFFKNELRKENDFITGEADIIDPYLMDTKSCWDLHTFYAAKTSELNKDYRYQMLGYCELYEFAFGSVCFTLIDTPEGLITAEKQKLFYKMNVPTIENPEYQKACEALEKEMKFDDIPMDEKIHEVEVKRNPAEMEKVYERIHLCREWLNEFANQKVLV